MKLRLNKWWGQSAIRDFLTYLWEEVHNPERDTSEWPLVTAQPARRSLTPRTVSRQLDKGKRRK